MSMFDDPRTTLILSLLVVCAALAAALVYEIVRSSAAKGQLAHVLDKGHAPDGKVLVPEEHVTVAALAAQNALDEKDALQAMETWTGGTLPKGWHATKDIAELPVIPQPAPLRRDSPQSSGVLDATPADSANPSGYFWRAGEMLGLSGAELVRFESKCATEARGSTDPVLLTKALKFVAGAL